MDKKCLSSRKQKGISVISIVALIVFFIVLAYTSLNYASYRVRQNLLDALEPIQQACQTEAGCPLMPEGWRSVECPHTPDLAAVQSCASPAKDSAYRALVYQAASDQFVVRWRYVSDSEYIVTGGKGQTLRLREETLK